MTPAEAAIVLARAAIYDRRTVGELEAHAWAKALGDITLTDAIEAVDEHYGETDRWLMPVHVRDRASRLARTRLGRARIAELEEQIAAENGCEHRHHVDELTAGGPPHPKVAAAIAPLDEATRLPATDYTPGVRAELLRLAAAEARRSAVALTDQRRAEAALARAKNRAAVDRARAELRRETPVVAT